MTVDVRSLAIGDSKIYAVEGVLHKGAPVKIIITRTGKDKYTIARYIEERKAA